MWTLAMFWYELRLLLSLALLLWEWHCLGWLRDALHLFAVCELSRLARLPAEIERLELVFHGPNACSAVLYGVQVKAPPRESDDRWEMEQIVTVDAVHVRFPLCETLLLYVCSFGELAVVHTLHVHGLRVNVEGHRTANNNHNNINNSGSGSGSGVDSVVFNVSLIGKRPANKKKRRRRKVLFTHTHTYAQIEEEEEEEEEELAEEEEQRARDKGLSTAAILEDYCDQQMKKNNIDDSETNKHRRASLRSNYNDNSSINYNNSSNESNVSDSNDNRRTLHHSHSCSHVELSDAHPTDSLSHARAHTETHTDSEHHSLRERAQSDVSQLTLAHAHTHTNTHAPSLLHRWRTGSHALRQTLTGVYHRTRQAIEDSVLEQINALHVHLSGEEPLSTHAHRGDFRFAIDHLTYDRVEIHMLRALPPQIQHLESKPLIVERLEFRFLGRGGSEELLGTKPSANSRYALTHRHSYARAHAQAHTHDHSHPHTQTQAHEHARPHSLSRAYSAPASQINPQIPNNHTHTLLHTQSAFTFHSASIESGIASKERESLTTPPLSPSPQRLSFTPHTSSDKRMSWSAKSHNAYNFSVSSHDLPVTPCVSVKSDKSAWGRVSMHAGNSESECESFETFLSLDIYDGGLDFRIFQYYFERKMLYALVRYNAGRIAYDMFFKSWHKHEQHEVVETHPIFPLFSED